AERTVLVLPERSGRRIHRQSLRASMSERIDLRQVSLLPDKRIVRRHASVVTKAQNLATVVARLLRAILLLTLADGEVQQAGPIERDAPAVVRVRLAPRVRDEDVFDVLQRRAVEDASRERGCGEVVLTSLRVTQVDDAV